MSIAFDIPAQFAAKHALGSIERYGTILKEVGSGRIVGHLQETGALHAMIKASGGSANPLASLINAASGVAANLQLYRLDNKVEALRSMMFGLQAMQVANLALAGIGIGVSVLGFAAVRSRLDGVSDKLDDLAILTRQGFLAQRASQLREYEARLAGQLDRAEEGWHARDGGSKNWSGAADELGHLENFYQQETAVALRDGTSPDMLAHLVDRYRVCVATKIECLVLLDEVDQGRTYAQKAGQRSAALFDAVTPITLAKTFLAVSGGEADDRDRGDGAGLDRLHVARALCSGLREIADIHATLPSLLGRVVLLQTRGRDYVEQLKAESREPTLILPASGPAL